MILRSAKEEILRCRARIEPLTTELDEARAELSRLREERSAPIKRGESV